MEYVTLNNGVKMPVLGYGVYKISSRDCVECVQNAVRVGYRLIDTAQIYDNEEAVGTAVRKSGVPRHDFFLTTKIWLTNDRYKTAAASIEQSLRKLQTDYIDLLLIHQPKRRDYHEIYPAMEVAYKAGKVRAIGVSNFYRDRFEDLTRSCEIMPAVNQMEMHVFQQQKSLHEFLKGCGTQIEAWAPFAEGRRNYFQNPVLTGIGAKYQKTAAQTALRFLFQQGAVSIPKTVHWEQMQENFNIFDFSLSHEDCVQIEQLDEGQTLYASQMHNESGTWLRANPDTLEVF